LVARILDVVGRMEKTEDQLRRKTGDLCTQFAKCNEVDGENFEHVLWAVTNLSFKQKIKIKIKLKLSTVIPRLTSDPANEFFG